MAGIYDCLSEALANGSLSREGFDAYTRRMKAAEEEAIRNGRPVAEAHAFAATEAAKDLRGRATQTILAVDRATEDAAKNEHGPQWGLTSVFAEPVRGTSAGMSTVVQQRAALGTLQSIMSDLLGKMQSRLFGLKHDPVLPRHVVSELYGTHTGDTFANAGAKAWSSAVEWWKQEMERAGVRVESLNDWRLPQHWDPAALRAVGQDGFVRQMQDWHQSGALGLRDFEKEGMQIQPGDDRAAGIFGKAWDHIVNPDMNVEPGEFVRRTVADRYGRRRVFEWTSDKAWLDFNRTFGVGDSAVGELMNRHIEHMSRDLGLVRTLGPDPERTKDILLQIARTQGVSAKWISRLEAMYDINSGKAMLPVDRRLALGMQSLRNFLTGVQLGGTVLSSLPDFAFTHATARWFDLDATRLMANYVAGLKGADPAVAMRKGLILEVGLRGLNDGARDALGDIQAAKGMANKWDGFLNGASRVTGRMAEFVIRAQGLAHHTQVLRDVIGGEIQERLGEMAAVSMKEMTGVERRLLDTYGITPKEWDLLRTRGLQEGFMSPAKLARYGGGAEREAASKLLGAIASIQRTAVPEGNSVTRALIMAGGARPGTPAGELVRSFLQYKGFGMSALMTTYFRAVERLADGEGKWNRAQWIASLVIGSTLLGGMSNQLKDIAAGKDPEPMDTGKFWARAFAQGGAGGIIGNEIQGMFQAQRMDDASRVLTPMGGLALDLAETAMGPIHGQANLNQQGTTRETFGLQATKLARKYTPSLWYTRLAQDRLLHDTLTRLADPDAAQTFQRMQEAVRKQGTAYWWRPGSGTSGPQRAPDLSRALP